MSSDETTEKKLSNHPSVGGCTMRIDDGLLGRLASVEAAGEATILTLAIASLVPVIEGSMAFVAATTASFEHALTVSSHQETQAYATVAQSVNVILAPQERNRLVAAVGSEHPEPLAVS